MSPDGATVRHLLDAPLREPRVTSLEAEAVRIAARPLDEAVADLRCALTVPVTGEDCYRLHVLVSTLHHRASAGLGLTEALREEIETARTTSREGR